MGDEGEHALAILPSHCLRGLRKPDWVDPETGVVALTAWLPDPKTAATRVHGGEETSINWQDDANVLGLVFKRKDQTQHGVARLPKSALDGVERLAACAGALTYERKIEGGNKHHGNLVFLKPSRKMQVKAIAGRLATESEFIGSKR